MLIYFLLMACSSDPATNEKVALDNRKTSIVPKNYLDFNYSKAVAFVSVDPFDFTNVYFKKDAFMSSFKDTISKTLDSSQTAFLNDILSGRKRDENESNDTLGADCFYPRHNIIFLDKKNAVVNYIAICFECNQRETSKRDLASMRNYANFFDSIGFKLFDTPMEHAHYYDSLNKLKKQPKR